MAIIMHQTFDRDEYLLLTLGIILVNNCLVPTGSGVKTAVSLVPLPGEDITLKALKSYAIPEE